MHITYITEQCGAKWLAHRTDLDGQRAYWVQLSLYSSPSVAMPRSIGFYAPSIEAACDSLNN